MRLFLGFLAVLFLAFPAYSQTAREQLRDDAAVDASGLSDEEKDALISAYKEMEKMAEKAAKEEAAAKRVKEMLEADPRLKSDLMNE